MWFIGKETEERDRDEGINAPTFNWKFGLEVALCTSNISLASLGRKATHHQLWPNRHALEKSFAGR